MRTLVRPLGQGSVVLHAVPVRVGQIAERKDAALVLILDLGVVGLPVLRRAEVMEERMRPPGPLVQALQLCILLERLPTHHRAYRRVLDLGALGRQLCSLGKHCGTRLSMVIHPLFVKLFLHLDLLLGHPLGRAVHHSLAHVGLAAGVLVRSGRATAQRIEALLVVREHAGLVPGQTLGLQEITGKEATRMGTINGLLEQMGIVNALRIAEEVLVLPRCDLLGSR